MKKILAFLLALVFAFALSACNNKDVAVNNNDSENIVGSLQGEKPPAENPKAENSQTENPKTENPKTENPKTENLQTENLQSENSQSENSQSENLLSENLGQKNSKPQNSQSEISQSSETKKDTKAQTTTSTQEEVKVEVAGTEQNKPSKKTETKDTTTQTTTPNNENITRKKAIEIALEHANLKEANVYDIDADIDREINATVWEVDFETKEYEYSYELDIKTGNITKNKKEPQDTDGNKDKQQTSKKDVVSSTKPTITRDRAIEIALSHAGLKRADARELDAELDKEKNGAFWEVDFETKEYEYSYNINAVTEEIITSEKERN